MTDYQVTCIILRGHAMVRSLDGFDARHAYHLLAFPCLVKLGKDAYVWAVPTTADCLDSSSRVGAGPVEPGGCVIGNIR